MNPQHDLKALNSNPFVGITKHTPRPVGPPDGKFGITGKADLARDQKDWDAAAAWAKENDELHAARVAGIAAKRAADADARRAAEADEVMEQLRRRYLASDPAATPEDFARDAPKILRQRRIASALETAKVGPPAGRRF